MFIDLRSEEYRNLTSCENQSGIFVCDHEGDCTDTCPCRINKTTCREACKCPASCPHRFPYCKCDVCGSECICKNNGRECVPGKCRNGKCTDRCSSIYPTKPLDSLIVKKSAIPGAGNGLFTQDSIKRHKFIGRYTGDILPDKQVTEFGEREMTAFTISKDMSIQGISPSNWVYWVNHPPSGTPSKVNARFLTVEGPTERFIVLLSTKRIYAGQEIFAEYSKDYEGFDGLSSEDELWTPDMPNTDEKELQVGEYVLIKGFVGNKPTERMAEVWVGLVAQIYTGGKYGIHWLYHHSHLDKEVQFPECPHGEAPEFEPWELIISEHTSIVDRDKIMTRVEMLERTGEVERRVGTWWWDWVLSYHRKYSTSRKRYVNVPILVSSEKYFAQRVSIDPWDLLIKAKGLTPTTDVTLETTKLKGTRSERKTVKNGRARKTKSRSTTAEIQRENGLLGNAREARRQSRDRARRLLEETAGRKRPAEDSFFEHAGAARHVQRRRTTSYLNITEILETDDEPDDQLEEDVQRQLEAQTKERCQGQSVESPRAQPVTTSAGMFGQQSDAPIEEPPGQQEKLYTPPESPPQQLLAPHPTIAPEKQNSHNENGDHGESLRPASPRTLLRHLLNQVVCPPGFFERDSEIGDDNERVSIHAKPQTCFNVDSQTHFENDEATPTEFEELEVVDTIETNHFDNDAPLRFDNGNKARSSTDSSHVTVVDLTRTLSRSEDSYVLRSPMSPASMPADDTRPTRNLFTNETPLTNVSIIDETESVQSPLFSKTHVHPNSDLTADHAPDIVEPNVTVAPPSQRMRNAPYTKMNRFLGQPR